MRPRDFTHLGLFVREAFLDDALLRQVGQAIAGNPGDPAEMLDAVGEELALRAEVRRAWDVTLPEALEQAVLERLEHCAGSWRTGAGNRWSSRRAVAALRYPTRSGLSHSPGCRRPSRPLELAPARGVGGRIRQQRGK